MSGPTLRFATHAVVALGGAPFEVTLDGVPMEFFRPIRVGAGQVLAIGAVRDAGCRAYLSVRGGIDVPAYLGSKTTFTLGGFGGHGGRALRRGDVLHVGSDRAERDPAPLPQGMKPEYSR